jgi:hypothetical protein
MKYNIVNNFLTRKIKNQSTKNDNFYIIKGSHVSALGVKGLKLTELCVIHDVLLL